MPSITELDRDLRDLETAVYGNGNGIKGLLSRVSSLEESRLSAKDLRLLLVSPFASGLVIVLGQAMLRYFKLGG